MRITLIYALFLGSVAASGLSIKEQYEDAFNHDLNKFEEFLKDPQHRKAVIEHRMEEINWISSDDFSGYNFTIQKSFLTLSVKYKIYDAAEMLIKYGADINAKDYLAITDHTEKDGPYSAFDIATKQCNAKFITFFINNGLRDSMKMDENWVKTCYANCCFDMVDQFVESGHLSLEGMHLEDSLNLTDISDRCRWDQTLYVYDKGIRKFGKDSEFLTYVLASGHNGALSKLLNDGVILKASDYGRLSDEDKARFLNIDARLENTKSEYWEYRKHSPLEIAIKKQLTAKAKTLIQLGAEINQISVDGSKTLLQFAYEHDKPIFKAICEAGANYDLLNPQGQNILYDALAKSDVETVDFLIERNIDILNVDNDGNTPLLFACMKSRGAAIEALLTGLMKSTTPDIGINQKNKAGFAPINLIVSNPHSGVSAKHLLIRNGADVISKGGGYLSPFLVACGQGTGADLDLLLQHGASIQETNEDGLNCILYAIVNRNAHTLTHLIGLGLNFESPIYPKHPLLFAVASFDLHIFGIVIGNMNFHSRESYEAANAAARVLGCDDRHKRLDEGQRAACRKLGNFLSHIQAKS